MIKHGTENFNNIYFIFLFLIFNDYFVTKKYIIKNYTNDY